MAGAALPPLRPLLCFCRRSPSTAAAGGQRTHPISTTSRSRRRNAGLRIRFCTTPPRFSPQTNSNQDQNPTPESSPASPETKSSSLRSIISLLGQIGADGIVLEIASIALPAVLALAADPLTSVVDTAFVGHVGSIELAAVGVSISVFNLVSKLFNVPLLNITTSFVAEEQALDGDRESPFRHNKDTTCLESELPFQEPSVDEAARGKKFLPAVSTSLVLAAGIGIVEAVALSFGSGILMNIMGIVADSPMRVPAENFLVLRALGAPAIVIALAAQGTFRGFKDTRTPLYAVGVGNLLNAILNPILMFLFGLGIDGAAIATVVADYLIAFILLWKLNTEVILVPSNIDGEKVLRYLKSGGLLIGRTIAVIGTVTLATSLAARKGPIPMAGHQICLQIWLAISLLNDSLALAGQALLASEYTKGNYKQARLIIYRVLQISLGTGLALAVILFLGFGPFCNLFTTDAAVLAIARSGVLFVTASQPINALAFVLDGLYYGVSDFAYAAYSMVLVGLVSSVLLLVLAPIYGLAGVWTGLFIFMTLRVVAGFWRLGSKTGPWQMIWSEMDTGVEEK